MFVWLFGLWADYFGLDEFGLFVCFIVIVLLLWLWCAFDRLFWTIAWECLVLLSICGDWFGFLVVWMIYDVLFVWWLYFVFDCFALCFCFVVGCNRVVCVYNSGYRLFGWLLFIYLFLISACCLLCWLVELVLLIWLLWLYWLFACCCLVMCYFCCVCGSFDVCLLGFITCSVCWIACFAICGLVFTAELWLVLLLGCFVSSCWVWFVDLLLVFLF